MDFEAVKVGEEIEVKAKIVKDGDNITVHVPSFKLIKELKSKYGKRNIQSI